jgi:hypothetical protein
VKQDNSKREVSMENQQTTKLPKLAAKVSIKENALVLEYKFKNSLETPIYIFSVMWDMNEKGAFLAKEQIYAYLGDDKMLYLSKKIPKLPSLQSVEFREIPYVRKVEPNEEYVETVSLTTPVEEFNPYFYKSDESKTEERLAEYVHFELQFIRASEELEVEKTGIEGVSKVWHPDLFGNVETLESIRTAIDVKVNKRLDEFEPV